MLCLNHPSSLSCELYTSTFMLSEPVGSSRGVPSRASPVLGLLTCLHAGARPWRRIEYPFPDRRRVLIRKLGCRGALLIERRWGLLWFSLLLLLVPTPRQTIGRCHKLRLMLIIIKELLIPLLPTFEFLLHLPSGFHFFFLPSLSRSLLTFASRRREETAASPNFCPLYRGSRRADLRAAIAC